MEEKRKTKNKVVMVTRSKQGGKKLVYDRKLPTHNFLKYWRIVKYWVKRKYEISESDLEVLLFLYDEGLFTRKQFKNFTSLLSWDKDRLNKYIEKGYIVLWREHKGYKQRAKLYTLSVKAKRMCNSVYKKLTQEEKIPENSVNNPIFKGDQSTDKIYRRLIQAMNKSKI